MSRNDEARHSILSKVKEGLRASPAQSTQAPPPARTSVADESGLAELRAAFGKRLEQVGGCLHEVANEDSAAAAIQNILQACGAQRVVWSDAAILTRLASHVKVGEAMREATVPQLLSCDAAVTTAQWGVAETGSLVLESNQENHRLASLLPPVHIAVLDSAKMLGTLGGLLERLNHKGGPAPAITIITGPSRTADIELTLVVGVHGPCELHVVLCNEIEG